MGLTLLRAWSRGCLRQLDAGAARGVGQRLVANSLVTIGCAWGHAWLTQLVRLWHLCLRGVEDQRRQLATG
jgi:hypothetical protein